MILRSGRWDEARWGAPINQHDMSATTLLFSLAVINGLRELGLEIDGDEAEQYMALWRYVGWVIGCDRDLTPASWFQATQLADLIRATQGAPDDDARALTAALFDSPLSVARTPKQVRRAKVEREIGRGVARAVLGDEMADALAVPRTPMVRLVQVLRGINAAAEPLRRRVPAVHQRAILAGHRYWDRVVEIGLAGATAEFRPPEKLAAVAA
jgi:hypothetical protein